MDRMCSMDDTTISLLRQIVNTFQTKILHDLISSYRPPLLWTQNDPRWPNIQIDSNQITCFQVWKHPQRILHSWMSEFLDNFALALWKCSIKGPPGLFSDPPLRGCYWLEMKLLEEPSTIQLPLKFPSCVSLRCPAEQVVMGGTLQICTLMYFCWENTAIARCILM